MFEVSSIWFCTQVCISRIIEYRTAPNAPDGVGRFQRLPWHLLEFSFSLVKNYTMVCTEKKVAGSCGWTSFAAWFTRTRLSVTLKGKSVDRNNTSRSLVNRSTGFLRMRSVLHVGLRVITFATIYFIVRTWRFWVFCPCCIFCCVWRRPVHAADH